MLILCFHCAFKTNTIICAGDVAVLIHRAGSSTSCAYELLIQHDRSDLRALIMLSSQLSVGTKLDQRNLSHWLRQFCGSRDLLGATCVREEFLSFFHFWLIDWFQSHFPQNFRLCSSCPLSLWLHHLNLFYVIAAVREEIRAGKSSAEWTSERS